MLTRKCEGAADGSTLCGLPLGEEGVVVRLHGSAASRMKLFSLGVVPGAGVVLEQRRPGIVFRMGHSRFAVDEELGSSIEVRSAAQPAV
jgi:Fe2+ transport system protein FeoA